MADFTPGPWEIIQLPSMQYRIDARQGPLHVCPAIANSLPDAILIAAAPDLLAALKLILPLAKGYAPEGQSRSARRTCDEWIAAAIATVERAEAP